MWECVNAIIRYLLQHAIDGVGGAEAIALEEGVKVECLIVGMR